MDVDRRRTESGQKSRSKEQGEKKKKTNMLAHQTSMGPPFWSTRFRFNRKFLTNTAWLIFLAAFPTCPFTKTFERHMGCGFSCTSSSTFNNVRVVHLNGYVEEFDPPVAVSQVTGKPALHFVCTPAQLLSAASKPLKADSQLEAGHVYFLLPISMFRSEVSPVDLASMVSKLTAIAKGTRREAKSHPGPSFSASPTRTASSPANQSMWDEKLAGAQRSCRSRSWKPILSTIRERSFNRRSESDLQREYPEMGK